MAAEKYFGYCQDRYDGAFDEKIVNCSKPLTISAKKPNCKCMTVNLECIYCI